MMPLEKDPNMFLNRGESNGRNWNLPNKQIIIGGSFNPYWKICPKQIAHKIHVVMYGISIYRQLL